MEDISILGYEMTEKPLDYDGSALVAQRLAKFHAASIYLQANVCSSLLEYLKISA